jgi:hypothetical protein
MGNGEWKQGEWRESGEKTGLRFHGEHIPALSRGRDEWVRLRLRCKARAIGGWWWDNRIPNR